MHTLVNNIEYEFIVIGFRYNMGLWTILQSMMFTKKNTESVQKTEVVKFVVLICRPITYKLLLSENWFRNLHSVTEVKTD